VLTILFTVAVLKVKAIRGLLRRTLTARSLRRLPYRYRQRDLAVPESEFNQAGVTVAWARPGGLLRSAGPDASGDYTDLLTVQGCQVNHKKRVLGNHSSANWGKVHCLPGFGLAGVMGLL